MTGFFADVKTLASGIYRIWRIYENKPKRQTRHRLYLIGYLLSTLSNSILHVCFCFFFFRLLRLIESNQWSDFPRVCLLMLSNNMLLAALKATANYFSMRLCVLWRCNLTEKLHEIYVENRCRLYYTLNVVDSRVDNIDQRITNDVDQMLQFLTDFVLGGILKPEAGIVTQVFIFLTSTILIFNLNMFGDFSTVNIVSVVSKALGYAVLIFLCTLIPCLLACNALIGAHINLQNSEAEYRITHSKAKINAETVAFYGGGQSELHYANKQFGRVLSGMGAYRNAKWFLDMVMLLSLQMASTASRLLSTSFNSSSNKINVYLATFLLRNIFESLMDINQSLLDFTSGAGFILRVSKFVEIAEVHLAERRQTLAPVRNQLTGVARHRFLANGPENENSMESYPDSPRPGWLHTEFPPLEDQDLLAYQRAQHLRIEHMDIFTPDLKRLLIPDFGLQLELNQSCLIMGPSGIGKSSITRVIAGIWPCKKGAQTRFERPPSEQLFFLSQTPYLEEVSLLENILYPVDDERIREETTMEDVLAWSKLCNFEHIWQKSLEAEGEETSIPLATVLSLGEQQRLQFVRLLCHYSFFKRHHPFEAFLALLDESTSAMDSLSEAMCYQAVSGLNMGFISVAHRPTVIQYHDLVLQLRVAEGRVTYTVEGGQRAAEAAAIDVMQYGRLSHNIYGVVSDDEDETALFFPKTPQGIDLTRLTRWKSLITNKNLLETEEEEIKKALKVELSENRVYEKPEDDFRVVLGRIYKNVKKREVQRVSIWNDTPYESFLEPQTRGWRMLRDLRRVFRLGVPSLWSALGLKLLGALAMIGASAYFEASLPRYQSNFTQEVANPKLGVFSWAALRPLALQVVGYTLLATLIKAYANKLSYSFFMGTRDNLNTAITQKYFDERAQNFYTMNHLDTVYDSVDQRISADAEQTLLYATELILGGLLKPTSGLMYLFTIFCLAIYGVATNDKFRDSEDGPWLGRVVLVLGASLFVLLIVGCLIYMLSRRLAKAQQKQQLFEASFRYAHTKLKKDAESIAFFQGEKVTQSRLNDLFRPCWKNAGYFARTKLLVDGIQMAMYYLVKNMVNVISGLLYFYQPASVRSMMEGIQRMDYFDRQNETLNKSFTSVLRISRQVLDFTKFQASLTRFSEVVERMDVIHEFAYAQIEADPGKLEDKPAKGFSKPAYVLTSDPIVRRQDSDCIRLNHCNIGTPDGTRVLIRDLGFQVLPGKSILIKGPSGLGKSSILRAIAGLWPIYENKVGPRAELQAPKPSSLMLVAQKPYMSTGSFREQFAYPVRDPRHLTELTDERLRLILEACNLHRFLESSPAEWDDPNIKLGVVLSLGEQQRVQFGRVFWHHWCRQLFGEPTNQGFFAILDESTSSMDVESEAICYQNLRARNIGFLSISHRATTVQFHDEVLEFYEDLDPQSKGMSYRIIRAYEVAQDIAAEIRGD